MKTRMTIVMGAAALVLLRVAGNDQGDQAWTREAFLGIHANDPEVTRLVQSARTNSEFSLELRSPRTDSARAALLRIAYGESGDSGRVNAAAFAAGCYVDSLEDKSGARALLIATNREVVDCGLRALRGRPVDAELFARLKVILLSDSARLRATAAKVLGDDKGGATAEDKVHVVLESMKTVEDCKDASRKVLVGEPFFFHPWSWAEIALDRQACAMADIIGRPPPIHMDMPLPPVGMARDFVIIARAKIGDSTIRLELREVCLRSGSVWARIAAVGLLLEGPTSEDIATVKKVAESDPFQARPTPFYFRMPDADRSLKSRTEAKIYPVRYLAQQGLKRQEQTRP